MKTSLFATIAATIALTGAQAAEAKQACVAPADVSAAAMYVLPIAYDAAKSTCSRQLKANGFMATKGDAFIAPFRAKQAKSWPGAYRVLKTYMQTRPDLANAGGFDVMSMLNGMPDNSVRPFADGIIGQMVAGRIKPANCSKIERGMELVGPLPTDNVAGLFAFVADVAELKNPSLCDPRTK